MNSEQHLNITESDLKLLENRVEELVSTVAKLTEENRALRASQSKLVSERAELIEKSELAKSRVEAMINRLKALEVQP